MKKFYIGIKNLLYVVSVVLPLIDLIKGFGSGIKKGLEEIAKSEFEKDESQYRSLKYVINSEHGTITKE